MFRKELSISGCTLLKSKDVKKLRSDALQRFPCATEKQIQLLVPNKTPIEKIKFHAPCRILVYLNADTKEPLFFDANGKGNLYPTLYSLWKCPEMLPPMIIGYPASKNIMNGADVMVPGVVNELQDLKEGEIRAVYASGNPIPFALGDVAVSSENMSHNKGKALIVVHSFNDLLYSMGPKIIPNEGFQATRIVPVVKSNEEELSLENITFNEETTTTTTTTTLDTTTILDTNTTSLKEEDEIVVSNVESLEENVKEMEKLLFSSFLIGLQLVLKHKDLPILSNVFYSNYLLPSRPIGKSINLKKTKYKKMSVFLKHMANEGFLTTKEENGIESIVDIDRSHSELRKCPQYKTVKQMEEEEEEKQSENIGSRMVKEIKITEFLRPHAHLQKMVQEIDSTKEFFTPKEVKDLFNRYIDQHQLQDPNMKQYVIPDGNLIDALYKNHKMSVYPTRLAKHEATSLFLEGFQNAYSVQLYPNEIPKIKIGSLAPVIIKVENRMGKKKVTVACNLEIYGIVVNEIAQEAQHRFACSSTLEQVIVKGKKMKELHVQGQHAESLQTLLISKYGIPRKYIQLEGKQGGKQTKQGKQGKK